MTYTLVLLRHGQSEGNAQGVFTGWQDVPLTELGFVQARRAGELLRSACVLPDIVHTSLRRRAITTANLALDVADRHWIPVKRSWRLNERHYGALQGKDKAQVREEFGDEAFRLWRRSYGVAPPTLDPTDPAAAPGDGGVANEADRPAGEPDVLSEALRDVVVRALPYWRDAIVPDLRTGEVVLVAAHGNSIRALLKHIDRISDQAIADLEIPNGIPLVHEFDETTMEPLVRGGTYLDPDAAAEAIAGAGEVGR
jgi:2,3-bisphosphoglycerate-dependent phosphoglycerate mutase